MTLDIRTPTDGQRSAHRSLPALLRDRDKERLTQYRSALAFYEGKQWPNVRTTVSRLRRLTVNYLRTLTVKVSSYVMQGVAIDIQPLHTTYDAEVAAVAAQDALTEISDSNGLPLLDATTEIDTAVIGDGAFKITWDPREERVAITAPDMSGVFPWPHPTDPSRFHRLAHRYQLPAADAYAFWGLTTRNETAWVIEDWKEEALAIHIDDHPNPDLVMPNPYNLIPYVVFPNEQVPKRWWGASDILPLTEIAEELNAEFSRLSNILELSGNPIAVLENVEQTEGIETFPGATWTLPEGARAYVLDLLMHGAIGQHTEYLNILLNTLHDLSETPRSAFGSISRDLSGVALQMDIQPLLHKVSRKRTIRTQAYKTRAGIALHLLDLFTDTDHLNAGKIVPRWASIVPPDKSMDAGRETALVAAGLSSRLTSMKRMGEENPIDEFEQIKKEGLELGQITMAIQGGSTPPPTTGSPGRCVRCGGKCEME